MTAFMDQYNLDGLDIDLEGKDVANANTLISVIKALEAAGKIVTAAPEAAQKPLNAYK